MVGQRNMCSFIYKSSRVLQTTWHFHKLSLYNERQKVKVKIAHMSLDEILVRFISKNWIVEIKCNRISAKYALYIYLTTENNVNSNIDCSKLKNEMQNKTNQ